MFRVVGSSATGRAEAPEDDLCLVDREPVIAARVQAWTAAHRTVDVDREATRATDEVVVVVVDPIFVSGRRPRRLDAPDETLVGQRPERVVHGLARDRPDVGPHAFLDVVGGDVGTA